MIPERMYKIMKKIIAMALATLLMCMLFTACGEEVVDSNTDNPPAEANSQQTGVSSNQVEVQENAYNTMEGINPFTGLKKADDYPDGKRAVAIMINNRIPALPHKGTSQADVIYEMVTEGGITRIMAVFSDYRKVPDVGMIRSARDQFVQLMFPYQALYVHIGESTLAQDMMDRYGYAPQNLDGKAYSSLWWMGEQRDPTCYTCFTNGELIQKTLEQYNDRFDDNFEAAPIFNFVHYDKEARVPGEGVANSVHVQFSSEYFADFTYDEASKKYLKYDTRGQAQLDEDNNQQLAFDNVLVMFTDIHTRENSPLAYVDFASGGYGYYMSQGHYEMVRWIKGDPNMPLRIVDLGGHEIDVEINCGKSYVAFSDINTMFDKFNIDGVNPYLVKQNQQ